VKKAKSYSVTQNAKRAACCEEGGGCTHLHQAINVTWRQPSAPMAVLNCASMCMAPLIGANGYHTYGRQWLPVAMM